MISISWPCAWTWMAEDNFRRDYRADLHGTGINSSYFCTNKQIMETNVCLCFGWCRTLTSQRQQDEDASVSIIFFFAFSLRPWCLTFSSILMRLCCFCVWPLLPLIYPFIRVYPLFCHHFHLHRAPSMVTFCPPWVFSLKCHVCANGLSLSPRLPWSRVCSYQDLSHFEFYLDSVFSFSVFICVQRILMNFPTPRKHHTLTTFFS